MTSAVVSLGSPFVFLQPVVTEIPVSVADPRGGPGVQTPLIARKTIENIAFTQNSLVGTIAGPHFQSGQPLAEILFTL